MLKGPFFGRGSKSRLSTWKLEDKSNGAELIKQMVQKAPLWQPGVVPRTAQTAENITRVETTPEPEPKEQIEPNVVTLTDDEILLASMIATRRYQHDMNNGSMSATGQRGPFQYYLDQALSESAFAKHQNWFWSGAPLQSDVAICHRERVGQDPYVTSELDDKAVVVLVAGVCPEFSIVGWIRARDARRDEWKQTTRGRTLWFVPVDQLKPITKGKS